MYFGVVCVFCIKKCYSEYLYKIRCTFRYVYMTKLERMFLKKKKKRNNKFGNQNRINLTCKGYYIKVDKPITNNIVNQI